MHGPRLLVRSFATASALALVIALFAGTSSAQTDPPPDAELPIDEVEPFDGQSLEALAAARTGLGLPTDLESTAIAMESPIAQMGYDEFGAPLTQAEWDYLQEYLRVDEVRDLVLERLGDEGIEVAYSTIDGTGEPRAVLGVFGDVAGAEAIAAEVFADEPITVVKSEFSFDELNTAVDRVARELDVAAASGLVPEGVQVVQIAGHSSDEPGMISVQVVSSAGLAGEASALLTGNEWSEVSSSAAELASALSAATKLNVVVEPSTTPADDDCTRWDCWSSLRAGLTLRHPGAQNPTCTMGLHVLDGTVRRFITAAHCSHGNRPNSYEHDGTLVGIVVDDSKYATGSQSNPGIDAMTVSIGFNNSTDRFYRSQQKPGEIISKYKANAFTPNQLGKMACKSGATTYYTCGTLYGMTPVITAVSSTCNCFIRVVQINYSDDDGDSGAPVVRQGYNSDCSTCRTAWGIHQGDGRFTPVNLIFDRYGLTLR